MFHHIHLMSVTGSHTMLQSHSLWPSMLILRHVTCIVCEAFCTVGHCFVFHGGALVYQHWQLVVLSVRISFQKHPEMFMLV